MASKVIFNSISLGDIKFTGNSKGYNSLEVDTLLDKVIQDYEFYENFYKEAKDYIGKLQKDYKKLKDEKQALEIEISKNKTLIDSIKNKKGVTGDNINLYQRIDALEKALWARGVDPSRIKY